MTASTAKGLAGLCFLVFLSLGAFPLVQWFAFDHASRVIGVLFGRPGEPWVWVIPALITVVAFLGMWYFGDKETAAAGS
ncbi:hypothetical protein ACQP1U_01575 [Actinomycetota bacterium]|nr:hypothetical protein [Micrococcales bacterium]